jgi:hypothetical protein
MFIVRHTSSSERLVGDFSQPRSFHDAVILLLRSARKSTPASLVGPCSTTATYPHDSKTVLCPYFVSLTFPILAGLHTKDVRRFMVQLCA